MNDYKDGEVLYQVWAPGDSVWSRWVAPVLFTQIVRDDAPSIDEKPEVLWINEFTEGAVVILDLPGAQAFRIGMALAEQHGFRPVPVINSSPGPIETPEACVVDMRDVMTELCKCTPRLRNLHLPNNSPPAFLLDATRSFGNNPAMDGMFDNRWLVFPQDFPSGSFLGSQGISKVLLVQEYETAPQEDLAHVLLRWQEANLNIYSIPLHGLNSNPERIVIKRPSRFKALQYRAVAIAGLRRGSVGGFGAYLPNSSTFG